MQERSDSQRRVAVITPAYNDWACLPAFLDNLAGIADSWDQFSVIVVDDGSSSELDPITLPDVAQFYSVEILRLGCNLGHQRAIAVGLAEVVNRQQFDAVVTIDVDGEDRPQDIASLLAAQRAHPDSIVVAQRRARSEAIRFRLFYAMYKKLFYLLTGKHLDFGNFAAFSIEAAQRMVLMSELWNHFPATVMRSKIPLIKIPLDRQPRTTGVSRMNFSALVNHGLAAIAAFIDTVFVRLIVTTIFVGSFVAFFCLAAVLVTLLTSLTISGWLTMALGFALLGLFQVLAVLIIVSFLALSARSSISPPPSEVVRSYIDEIELLSVQPA